MYDIIIVGSGAAGCTAAIYAVRGGFKVLLLTGLSRGGQLTITEEVENYPGFISVGGGELMDKMLEQVESLGAEVIDDHILSSDFSSSAKELRGSYGEIYRGSSIIIATGAKARWLGLEKEEKYKGRGVSTCATCDGFFFRDKVCAVVGGGNTAVEEALYLAKICKEVTLIHRRDSLRADKVLQDKLYSTENIEIRWSAVVSDLLGDGDKLTGLELENTKDGVRSRVEVDGLFVAIGHIPSSEAFRGSVDTDADGIIKTYNSQTHTNIEGVYVAGDVADRSYRQAITAAGYGCMAALEATRYLNMQATTTIKKRIGE